MDLTVAPPDVVLIAGVIAGAVWDGRTGRIPNALTLPMAAVGIAIHTVGSEPLFGLIGVAAAFAVHFPLFALGVQRGGDAKLMMGIGGCIGAWGMIEATLWLALLYLPMGLAVLAIRGKLGNLVATARYMAAKAQGHDPGEAPAPTTLRTGPIIAAAAIFALTTDWLRWDGLALGS